MIRCHYWPPTAASLSVCYSSLSLIHVSSGRTDRRTERTNEKQRRLSLANVPEFFFCIAFFCCSISRSARPSERERERVVLLHIIALRRLPRCAHADTLTAHTPSKLARALHSILTASLCVSFLLFLLSYFIQWPSFVRAGPFSTFDAQPQCQKVFFKRLNYLVAVTLCVPASA